MADDLISEGSRVTFDACLKRVRFSPPRTSRIYFAASSSMFHLRKSPEQRVDAFTKLGQEGDLVSHRAVAFDQQDRIDQDRNHRAFRIVEFA